MTALLWHDSKSVGPDIRETEYLDEVAGDVPACDVQASRQVGQAEALIHWTDVCHAIPRVDHHTSQKA